MFLRGIRCIFGLSLVTTCGLSQPIRDDATTNCVTRLRVPAYSVFSRASRLEGTAEVSLELGPGGKPKDVRVSGVHAILEKEVRENIQISEFAPRCEGATLRLYFEFHLEGPEVYGSFQSKVSYSSPNRFIIVTSPPKMIVN
jgi:hypothetical protein